MSLTPWDPWRELDRVRAQTEAIWNRFLQQLPPTSPVQREGIAFLPDIDFVETRDDYRLYIAAPGLVEEDLDITVRDNQLVVRGERAAPYDLGRAHRHLAEWRYGYFERRIAFPQRIDVGTLRATYEAGVLTIVLAKGESA